ncbi:uncharacterized protein B0I36DRAFT_358660 [Microdochium trichocladiopsis]|uniref:Uncharacterized protein n=1 Tax=Microdochium trichocladiopsis TaxID=1682393 RepID=A0A9P8YJM6_9PEZI|nr:uncharacterized protein B0I36DRAFT_358660 [Microdochium trichocladiopsis]KAH7041495.1 hypothetical protein B0I36DRAFT_358660 [Microdochium trichocladiopsis]
MQSDQLYAIAGDIPHPDLQLPAPSLSFDFRMAIKLQPLIALGTVPGVGQRNWMSLDGGRWSATFGTGTVVTGGNYTQTVDPRTFSVRMDTMYLLKTDDEVPAYIEVRSQGYRTGPRDVLREVADPNQPAVVDARAYSSRHFITMETGDARYADRVNHNMWVGSGMRMGDEVIFDAYRVTRDSHHSTAARMGSFSFQN